MQATATQPATQPIAANDNHKPAGAHEWPAHDRLRAGTLMRTPDANRAGLVALLRLRADLRQVEPSSEVQFVTFGEDAAIGEDVRVGFGSDLKVERVTAEHLIALQMAGALEYRPAPDGQVLPFKRDGQHAYQVDDRYRGELGPKRAEHASAVEDELNSRYSGAAWPTAPGAARQAHGLFNGAKIRSGPSPRTWTANDGRAIERMFARRRLAFVEGAVTKSLMTILRQMADGETAMAIGESRGHRDRYASAVGTELQRVAVESLLEAYADYDGCHASSDS